MKKIGSFIIIISLALIYTSCGEEEALTPNPTYTEDATGDTQASSNTGLDNGNGGSSSTDQFMTATIDGIEKTFGICDADTFGFFLSEFEISGYDDILAFEPIIKQDISFEIYDENYVLKEDTTYSLDSNEYITAIFDENLFIVDDSVVFFSQSGQIRFTKVTPSGYEGTFNFDGKSADDRRSVSITNGSFKAVIKEP